MSEHWLVIGLGNPGSQYESTRHNVGYLAADVLLNRHSGSFKGFKGAPAQVGDIRVGGAKVTVIRSNTFMNDSGKAVAPLAQFYKLGVDRIIAVHDELDLEFGQLRIKLGGGINGHNGLKSMRTLLGSEDFYRVRLGIGRPSGRMDPASFVLAPFSSVEQKDLGVYVEEAADAVESLIAHGLDITQQRFNR